MKPWLKGLLPQTLFARFFLILITPLILLQLVAGWIFYDRHWDLIVRRFADQVASDIRYVLTDIKEHPDELARITDNARKYFGFEITFDSNAVLTGESPQAGLTTALLSQALAVRVNRPYRVDTSNLKERVLIYLQFKDEVMTIVVPGKRLFSSSSYIFLLWMIGTSLVLLAIAIVFMRNQVRPVARLAQAVEEFGKGRDDGVEFKPSGAIEVRRVGAAFTAMRARVRDYMRQRTTMLAGVSHDLRTPLTRMKLRLEVMPAPEQEIVKLKENIVAMEKMLEGYLSFARGEGSERPETTDIATLLNTLVSNWRESGANIVDYHVEDKVVLPVRPLALSRAVDNLLGNAYRHAGHIWVRLSRRKRSVQITVDDDGPGIPRELRALAFQPFERLEVGNPEGGTGLGLTIARDVCRAHGGDLSLSDSPSGGLRAVITLPL